MAQRGRRAVRRGYVSAAASLSLSQAEAHITATFRNWMRADSLAATSLQDKITGAHTMALTGSTTATTPAALGGREARTFSGTGNSYNSNQPAAYWSGQYSGTGSTSVSIFVPGSNAAQFVANTLDTGSTPGCSLDLLNAGAFNYDVYTAGGVACPSLTAVGAYTIGVATYLFRTTTAGANGVLFKQKRALLGTRTLASPSAAGTQTLRIGNYSAGGLDFVGDFADYLYSPTIVSGYTEAVVARYAFLRYGIPL